MAGSGNNPMFLTKSAGDTYKFISPNGTVQISFNFNAGVGQIAGDDATGGDLQLGANTVDNDGLLLLKPDGACELRVATGQSFIVDENGTDFLTLNRTGSTYTTDDIAGTAWDFDVSTITSGVGVQINLAGLVNGTGLKITADSDNLTTGALIDFFGGSARDKSWFKIIKNTGDTETGQVIIDADGGFGTAAKPNLVFGDGDTGFRESADDSLEFTAGGVDQMTVSTSGLTMGNTIATQAVLVQRVFTAINYSTLPTDYYIGVNTAAPVQITLSTADVAPGRVFVINDETGNAAIAPVTVVGQGGETIDGAPAPTIAANYGSMRLISDGVNWFTW